MVLLCYHLASCAGLVFFNDSLFFMKSRIMAASHSKIWYLVQGKELYFFEMLYCLMHSYCMVFCFAMEDYWFELPPVKQARLLSRFWWSAIRLGTSQRVIPCFTGTLVCSASCHWLEPQSACPVAVKAASISVKAGVAHWFSMLALCWHCN